MSNSPEIDFHDFHLLELPRRLAAGNDLLAATAARELPAIGFRLKGTDNAYSYYPDSHTIAIIAGTEAETIIEMEQGAWQNLIYNLEKQAGLLTECNVVDQWGDVIDLKQWEQVLCAMFYGQ